MDCHINRPPLVSSSETTLSRSSLWLAEELARTNQIATIAIVWPTNLKNVTAPLLTILVSFPDPTSREEKGMVNLDRILGSLSMASADWAMQSLDPYGTGWAKLGSDWSPLLRVQFGVHSKYSDVTFLR